MAELSKSAQIRESIGGELVNSSLEVADLEFLTSSDNATNLNVSIQRVTFVRDAYKRVKKHIDDGNIYEGLTYNVEVFNETNSTTIEQWLDLTDDALEFPKRGAIQCKPVLKEGIQQLEDRLSAITYAYLEEINIITDDDYVNVDYSVKKKFDAIEIATIAVTIYIIITGIISRAENLSSDTATSSGITSSSVSGSLGAAVFSILIFFIRIAAAVAVAAALFELVRNLFGYFIQPKRTHKAMMLKTLLSKAAEQLGYGFETDIADLDFIALLPSNPNTDDLDSKGFISLPGTIKKGYPNLQDFGKSASEAYQGAATYFNAIYQVVNGVIQFRSENSDYWVNQSNYILPDVKETQNGWNTKELVASRIIKFSLDPITDEYTLDNFKGTNYAITTDIKNPVDPEASFIKGLDEINIPWALGTRNDKASPLEEILLALANTADSAIQLFGGNSNFANQVKTRIGTLKVSSNNHLVPKLLWLENGRIPADHREKLSAKVSWEKYWIYKSFVANNFIGQKLVFTDRSIPFGYEDFLNVSNNSYFRDVKGRVGQIVKLSWITSKDRATVSYWIREPHTENLKETFFEQE